MEEVLERIRGSVTTLTEGQPFKSWLQAQKLSKGSLVAINNSFVFRDKLNTTKNAHFLCLPADQKGTLSSDVLSVGRSVQFHTDFKHFSPTSANLPTVEDLETAARSELKRLGKLVFVLVGTVEDKVQIAQPVNHGLFDQIVLDPTLNELVRLDEQTIIVRDTYDEEALWTKLGEKAKAEELIENVLPEDLREPFAVALEKLTADAYAILRLPTAKKRDSRDTLLDSIALVLGEHVKEYRKSLRKCEGAAEKDANEFNNILRIAYNFASDATKVIRLLVSVCDLKPLLFWCTSAEWFHLSDCFRSLPWSKAKKKPSLTGYQETISGARNRAFHNIFPFTKSLEAELGGISLAAIRLRIFSEFKGKKSQNIFEYEDKALVEALTEFRRAGEKFVPPLFWRQNLDVMTATVSLLSASSNSLKELARHSRVRPRRA